ncbi:hypothetical protein BDW74DRAFT_184101 [Aspergillus multicolor]|uniref:uncharacterized protein n=1 Tax=Aspergillus multicolor TaxID=41759 RepID=UPI003CCE031C
MTAPPLSPEVWHLIFENLTTTQDIYNVCLVCHYFQSIATPLLYRSLTVAPGPEPWLNAQEISVYEHRLKRLDPSNNDRTDNETARPGLRNWVQEVTFVPSLFFALRHSDRDHLQGFDRPSPKFIQQSDAPLLALSRLPSLRRVTLTSPQLQSAEVIDLVANHPKRPEITLSLRYLSECKFTDRMERYVSNENGSNDETHALRLLLSRVSGLNISVDPFEETHPSRPGHRPNERMLAAQKLFFACPNLRSFSLSLVGNSGCMERVNWFPLVDSFRFMGTEVFPPLEKLALDGYYIRKLEWAYWRDGLDWSKLKALTLGPQDSFGLLGRLAGYATSLTTFKVYCYAGEDRAKDKKGLAKFLGSFDTLKMLDLKGYICVTSAIAHHRNLSTLCLHEDEPRWAGYRNQRRVLTVEELDLLDKQCPELRDLEVDIRRKDGELPVDVITKLSTFFANLQSLSLHFELGIIDREPIMPTITHETARKIGQMMFDLRRQCGLLADSDPAPYKITLWTGAAYRRTLGMPPSHDGWESKFTNTYEVRLPVDRGNGGHKVEVRLTKGEGWDPDVRRSETPDL